MDLPPTFVRNVTGSFPNGAAWLQNLPALLADCAARYDLTIAPTPFGLSFNYVAPAARKSDGREVVLKLGVPRDVEIATEIGALQAWNGKAVRLLASDEARGVLLMERLRPGTMLSKMWDANRDDEATEIAARVMRDLWPDKQTGSTYPSPFAPPFLTVADWAKALNEATHANCPPELLPQIADAKVLFAELGADTKPEDVILLHGDLHHFNILRDDGPTLRVWKAIDPHGVWGDKAYEAGAFLRNPWPGLLQRSSPQTITNRRLDIFADIQGSPREKLRLWAVASATLSAWWSVDTALPNGGDDWKHSARCAELLKAA